jgi:hypothetical protein
MTDSQPCGVSAVRMRSSSTRLAISGRDGPPDAGRVVWRDCAAVGQKRARVVEKDDAVAQQAPPLLGVEGDGVGRVTVRAVRWRARGPVRAHGEPLDQELRTCADCGPLLARSRGVLVTAPGVVPPLRDARRAERLHNRDGEIAGSHQGGEPTGPADGGHDIRPLTAPARPQRVNERGYAGPQFRVTPLAGRVGRDVRDAQAAAESGAIRHVRLTLLRVYGHPVPLPGEDTGELAESGVVRARARAGARGMACCAMMAIFIGCLLAGESSSRCLAMETENDA